MDEITLGTIMRQILAVLREAFEGPRERWSYFTDSGEESGMLGTVRALDAAAASRRIGGASVAAHVHHVVFALTASTAWIKGDRTQRNWAESWSVDTVDQAAWTLLLGQLRAGYDELRAAIEGYALSGEEAMGGAIGALMHAAYHLGAIQQKLAFAGLRG
jgi:hypothetical protein